MAWSNNASKILGNHLSFQSYLANPVVWFNAETYKTRNDYYTYILVYIDDLLIFEKYPQKYMTILESKYTVKPYSIGETEVYLGADVGKLLYGDGSYAWTMRYDLYVK